MDRLQRIYRLHQVIVSHRRPVPLRLLREKLECSRATVNRIIQEFRLHFNAPLEYDRERNGYYYALKAGERFELPGVWFSAAELQALLTVQQLLEGVQPGLLDSHLKPLRVRIEKILQSEQLGSGQIAKRVRILRMAGRNVQGEHFQTVAGALLQRKRLHIHYHGREANQETRREISPQRLTHYRDNWYLDAWCHQRNALRSFAVERIHQAQVHEQAARDVPEEELDNHFATAYGIFAGQPAHTAVLRFTPERARWVAEEQWHPQQQSCFLKDGSYELRLPYADPRELVMDILKYGPDVEVVEPETLRRHLHERLKATLHRYGGA
jgi:predicted DNA-binding transcriptional regulator YafY